MSETKPVLVTTDGSAHSLRVLPHAARLARARQAPFVLLQVLDRGKDVAPEPKEPPAAAQERARTRLQEELRGVLTRMGIANAEARVETLREGEKVADAILRVASECEVLAMDTRGHSALAHVLQGSVALAVLAGTRVPLLVTGPRAEPAPAASDRYRLVITNDGSPASEEVLRELGPVLEGGQFQVTLLLVHERAPGGQDDSAQVKAEAAHLESLRGKLPASVAVDTFVREIPRGGGIDTAIIEEAQRLNAHAIGISTHGHSARRHLIMGSTAMTLLGRSPLPLIVSKALD
jgi:nucleotide-binding universal stress UspA family protein